MNSKTRIALLAPYNVYPAKTGGKKFIALFHQYLSRILPVELISVKDNAIPEAMEGSFHGILGSSKFRYGNVFLFFTLKKLIREKRITDLIIVHPYFGWLAYLLKKTTGVKLSLLSHNIEAVRFKSMGKWWWKLLWKYEKKTHQITDHNFFVTAEDMAFAIKHYRLLPEKCDVITYGIDMQHAPEADERKVAGTILRDLYKIGTEEKILFFNGTLDYLPNIEAVEYIIQDINPLLMKADFKYRIIICGKGLPGSFNDLKDFESSNITYAGFVEDINLYFKGADIFLNPVITGGGIKTKLVEAIGNGLTAVSSESGACGVSENLVPGKLHVVKDFDWQSFAGQTMKADPSAETGAPFFNHFYWGNIAAKAAGIISNKSV